MQAASASCECVVDRTSLAMLFIASLEYVAHTARGRHARMWPATLEDPFPRSNRLRACVRTSTAKERAVVHCSSSPISRTISRRAAHRHVSPSTAPSLRSDRSSSCGSLSSASAEMPLLALTPELAASSTSWSAGRLGGASRPKPAPGAGLFKALRGPSADAVTAGATAGGAPAVAGPAGPGVPACAGATACAAGHSGPDSGATGGACQEASAVVASTADAEAAGAGVSAEGQSGSPWVAEAAATGAVAAVAVATEVPAAGVTAPDAVAAEPGDEEERALDGCGADVVPVAEVVGNVASRVAAAASAVEGLAWVLAAAAGAASGAAVAVTALHPRAPNPMAASGNDPGGGSCPGDSRLELWRYSSCNCSCSACVRRLL